MASKQQALVVSVLLALASIAGATPASAQAIPKASFNVVGSIGGLSMYTDREVPFWNETVPKESGGAINVRVKAFTELGFKGGEGFRLVSTGTLQLASALLPYTSGEVPMNEAPDLVGLVRSVEELREITNVFRPGYTRFLEEKHGIKLLGFGAYHAQVIYCRDSFTSIADLKGRKVRAAGASQQAFVNSLGGSPMSLAFPEVQGALSSGVIDCAITGSLSGYLAKWYESAKFISPMPINFGLVGHIANLKWWNTLDPKVQASLETRLRTLEDSIFGRPGPRRHSASTATPGAAPAARARQLRLSWCR